MIWPAKFRAEFIATLPLARFCRQEVHTGGLVAAGTRWMARTANSCDGYSRPTTCRRAAFDAKALGIWAIAPGPTVGDVKSLVSRPRVRTQKCREENVSELAGSCCGLSQYLYQPCARVGGTRGNWARRFDCVYVAALGPVVHLGCGACSYGSRAEAGYSESARPSGHSV